MITAAQSVCGSVVRMSGTRLSRDRVYAQKARVVQFGRLILTTTVPLWLPTQPFSGRRNRATYGCSGSAGNVSTV